MTQTVSIYMDNQQDGRPHIMLVEAFPHRERERERDKGREGENKDAMTSLSPVMPSMTRSKPKNPSAKHQNESSAVRPAPHDVTDVQTDAQTRSFQRPLLENERDAKRTKNTKRIGSGGNTDNGPKQQGQTHLEAASIARWWLSTTVHNT